MEELKTLKRQRGNLNAQLTLFSKFLKELNVENLTSTDITNLNSRLQKITPLFDLFNDVQTEIDCLEFDSEKSLEQREQFQNTYFSICAEATNIISRDKKETNIDNLSQSSHGESGKSNVNSLQVPVSHKSLNLSNIKLPPIDLPTFDGNFTKWHEFCDVFTALIHNNTELSDSQKLFYLRSALKNEPQERLNSIETSDRNYSIAWESLRKRYDNKRRIVETHITNILKLESVPRDSFSHLGTLINVVEINMQCLSSLLELTQSWDPIVILLILEKLDSQTNKEWESKLNSKLDSDKSLPSLNDLMHFLNAKLNTLEAISSKKNDKVVDTHSKYRKPSVKAYYSGTVSCPNCKGEHYITQCDQFKDLKIIDRTELIKKLKLCTNCFRRGHFVSICRSSKCKICSKSHHTMLHVNDSRDNVIESTTNCSAMNPQLQVILPTAWVNCLNSQGHLQKMRVLLDSASQSNFITESACQALGLNLEQINISVSGISQAQTNLRYKTQVMIHSLHNNFKANLHCLVLNKITNILPGNPIDIKKLNIPAHIKLADKSFHEPQEIDILIGASLFYNLLSIGQIKIPNGPILHKTKLGWVVSGGLSHSATNHTNTYLSLQRLHTDMANFWKVDEFDTNPKKLNKDDQYCESYFKKTTTSDSNGRFIVKIPFKDNLNDLGDSINSAKTRLFSLENRLKNNINLKTEYLKFMDEYEALGHMTVVDSNIDNNSFYLPHHAVIKEDSQTTKLRVVFDGSCSLESGIPVNATQHVGPTIQDQLFAILARFRTHEFVLSADVEKMYRQIWVHPEHRNYQKILWRNSPNDYIKTFTLNTVTYGTTSAPFLAVRCLVELAIENENAFPLESHIIKHDFYVDDLLTGSNTVESITSIKNNG